MPDERSTARIPVIAAADVTAAMVAQTLGDTLLRFETKLDRLSDRVAEHMQSTERTLADHGARIHGIEQDQANALENRRLRWAPLATLTAAVIGTVISTIVAVWVALRSVGAAKP